MLKSWRMAVCGIEPHEPEQPVRVNASEHVSDLRWLVGGSCRACLGDEDRVAGQRAYGGDRGPEQGSELPVRLEVVAVYPHPGHIGAARPPPGRGRDVAARRVVDDVHRPQPGHVPDSQIAEQRDDVPPGGYERRRGCVRVTPRGPPAVHLVAKAQDDRVAVGADGLSVFAQVAVVPSGSDPGDADCFFISYGVRIHLHERRRTVLGHGVGKLDRKGHVPSAVVHNEIWTGPGSVRERCDPVVRGRGSVRIHPQVGLGCGGQLDWQRPPRGRGLVGEADAHRDRSRSNDGHSDRRNPPTAPSAVTAAIRHRIASSPGTVSVRARHAERTQNPDVAAVAGAPAQLAVALCCISRAHLRSRDISGVPRFPLAPT